MNWFNEKHINISNTLYSDILGYVLPHASTYHTKTVINNTLRFIPNFLKKYSDDIYVTIIYYPVSNLPNVNDGIVSEYHEFYVIKKLMNYVIKNIWKLNNNIIINEVNVRDNYSSIKKLEFTKKMITIVSADFSHFLPFSEAIDKENCAANSLSFRITEKLDCLKVVDHIDSFKILFSFIPKNYTLQWIDRSRSSGEKGVGYLSFLISKQLSIDDLKNNIPDGFFVTAYDEDMDSRECLGNWKWNPEKEKSLITDVIKKGTVTSRLNHIKAGKSLVRYYTVTYLYKEKHKNFVRGWHGIKKNAFYLPTVFLENTHNNGQWIKNTDTTWKSGNWNMNPTLIKLSQKANFYTDKKNYILAIY